MNVTITPRLLRGAVTPPPSKSAAHRQIIAAALADGESVLSNVDFSEDITATLACMQALGAGWRTLPDGAIAVRGVVPGAHPAAPDALPRLDCGESGSTLRFLIPIALALAGGGVFTGRGRLMERPQGPYFDLFDQKGISHRLENGALTVAGRLPHGAYALPGDVSSQFVTGLLYALSLLEGDSVILVRKPVESFGYISMTIQALKARGVEILWREQAEAIRFDCRGGQRCAPGPATVEADWSQAGFYYAANGVGNDVDIRGMNPASIQGDRVIDQWRALLEGPPSVVSLDVSHAPDLVPPLAAWAALRNGRTILKNAARLRIKESDRLAAVTAELRKLGANVTEGADFLDIEGVPALTGGTVDSHNDHRIAMMLAVAATRCTGPVTICGAECVNKSYPGFWADYRSLGGEANET